MTNRTAYDLFSIEGKRALVTSGSVELGQAMAKGAGRRWYTGGHSMS